MKVMMENVRARIDDEAYAAVDLERDARLRWDALTPEEEQLAYNERTARVIEEAD